jgi:hypothetical protein
MTVSELKFCFYPIAIQNLGSKSRRQGSNAQNIIEITVMSALSFCVAVACAAMKNHSNRVQTSTQIFSVTRGGLAESLGVQFGWGLEKVGEVEVRNMQKSTITQILQMAQFPVVITFMLPRGETARTARGANLAHVPYAPVYTPPDLEISRHDNGNQHSHVVKPDWH